MAADCPLEDDRYRTTGIIRTDTRPCDPYRGGAVANAGATDAPDVAKALAARDAAGRTRAIAACFATARQAVVPKVA